MANKPIQNGQAEYGVVHVMEEEMRAAEQGVFEPHSSEAGMKRRRKAETAPANKMETAPNNKATISAETVKAPAKRKAK